MVCGVVIINIKYMYSVLVVVKIHKYSDPFFHRKARNRILLLEIPKG